MSIDEITVIERILYQSRLNYVLNTFPIVEYFWPNPYRTGWVSSIFFLNRYFTILGHIPIIIGLIPNKSCEVGTAILRNIACVGLITMPPIPSLKMHSWKTHHYKGYFGMALQLLVAVIALCSMRIYALYNKNNHILLALAALAGASIIVGFIAIATESDDVVIRVPPPIMPICHLSLGLSDEGTLRPVLSIAWGGLLAFDVTVFVLTLCKAVKMGHNTPLIRILVRDAGSSLPHLSSTLISRLMLRLRSDGIQRGHHSLGTVETVDAHFNSSLSELSSLWFPTNTTSHSAVLVLSRTLEGLDTSVAVHTLATSSQASRVVKLLQVTLRSIHVPASDTNATQKEPTTGVAASSFSCVLENKWFIALATYLVPHSLPHSESALDLRPIATFFFVPLDLPRSLGLQSAPSAGSVSS
ncbi:hypothetical protein EDB92DRAFT_1818741 [Lactarius akahatsu]|uniref:Uncharacterized protein n=1 Tax=Lactarius akahatsu TaxID=416441 RepID=A0AAD4QAF9_9AGAM|nr:hypothetical protein EDB92DRAFT_1818741 [Lactarius akahatsu]